MRNTVVAAIGGLAASLSIAGGAAAQAPGWAVGTWRGTLEQYTIGDRGGPDRVMTISADGKCTWDYARNAAAPAAARSCSVSGNGVELYTGGNSTVKLQHKDGKLQGTFTISAGKQFFLTLTKQ